MYCEKINMHKTNKPNSYNFYIDTENTKPLLQSTEEHRIQKEYCISSVLPLHTKRI